MERISELIAEKMLSNNYITNEEKELYAYFIQILIEKIIGYFAILSLSGLLNCFWQSIFFLIFFSGIRKYTAGLHMETFKSCLFISILIYLCWSLFFEPIFVTKVTLSYVILICSVLVIIYVGAVNNPEIDWSHTEEKEHKRLARIMVIIETIIIFLLGVIGIDFSFIVYMIFAVVLASISLLLEKIRREVKLR